MLQRARQLQQCLLLLLPVLLASKIAAKHGHGCERTEGAERWKHAVCFEVKHGEAPQGGEAAEMGEVSVICCMELKAAEVLRFQVLEQPA